MNLVLYSFGDDGGVSTLLQHFIELTKIIKEKNKKRGFMETKIKSIKKYIYKGK